MGATKEQLKSLGKGGSKGSQSDDKLSDLVPRRKSPLKKKWNIVPCILMLCYLASGSVYFWKRIEVMMLGWTGYQMWFLVLEFVGVSAFLPYAMLLMRGVYPIGSPGLSPVLPEDEDGCGKKLKTDCCDAEPKMHVRVLVPCYKEPLEVVSETCKAALSALLPEGVKRTLYLCDDGKDPIKKAYIDTLGDQAVYVSGRIRKQGEINGKSANLNNCLKNVIYKDHPKDKMTGDIDWKEIKENELIVVFDADMCAKPDFFLKILEVMSDIDVKLCLTPQAFHNIDRDKDLFNSINSQFWEYWLPGAFAWGYIACTGTNFCLRSRALCHCGWFPEYTITEDYALGMELKSRKYKAEYLCDYIAEGEAPEEIRNVFRQRSRWTKGHFQVFYSRHNPLINFDLPVFHRFLYAYATWSPFCTVLTVPGFMMAPFISVVWGLHPLVITYDFVLTGTIYFFVQLCIQFYVTKLPHLKLMWFVQMSNVVLWFTYTKAFFNATLAALGFKQVMFKATDKVVKAAGAVTAMATLAVQKKNEPKLLPNNNSSSPEHELHDTSCMPDDPIDEGNDVEATAFLHGPPGSNNGQFLHKPPRAPVKRGLGMDMGMPMPRPSSNGGMYNDLPGGGRRMSSGGQSVIRDSAMIMKQGAYMPYDAPRRTSHTGSLYDSPDSPPLPGAMPMPGGVRVSSNGGALMEGTRGDGYMPVPRLPASRHASHDGGYGMDALGTGRLIINRMDAPKLPEDRTFVMPTARMGDLSNGGATHGHDVTIVMSSQKPPASSIVSDDAPLLPHLQVAEAMHHHMGSNDGRLHGDLRTNMVSMRDLSTEVTSSDASLSPTHLRTAAVSMGRGSYNNLQHLGHHPLSHYHSRPDMVSTPAYSHTSGTDSFNEHSAGLHHVAPPELSYDEFDDIPDRRSSRHRSTPGFDAMSRDHHNAYPPIRSSMPGGFQQPQAAASYDHNGIPSIPAVGPYGMVQMVPTAAPQYVMMPQMALPPGYRVSYAGTDYNPSEEKIKLLNSEDSRSDLKKGMTVGGSSRGGDDDDDRGEEEKTHENKAGSSKARLVKIIKSFKPANVADFGKMFDPLALLVMWLFNMLIVSLGLWQLIILFNQPTVSSFKFDSPLHGNPYLVIAVLWAFTNSIAPYMFLHYCFSSGATFRSATKWLPPVSMITMIAGVVLLWLMIPTNVELTNALDVSLNNYMPNQILQDTNDNWLFVSGVNGTVVSLPSLITRGVNDPLTNSLIVNATAADMNATPDIREAVDLLGGLLTGLDHTKAVMPTAHTITWLVWGALMFPTGYTSQQLNQLTAVVKEGADLLMRSNLNVNDPKNPIFVAQLGDPANYTVISDPGYDPVKNNKSWTSPAQDPQLNGAQPRKAWVLTRETVGADVLAGASAALAAASMLVRASDPTWAANALYHARYLNDFAMSDANNAQSYCQFVPCTGSVTVSSQVKALPVVVPDGEPVCYWVDWLSQACRIEISQRDCDARKRLVNEVFTTKSACCSYLSSLNVWSQTYTKAQGICALPDNQWQCYMPDLAQRTCYTQNISQTTGEGCAGKAMEVFATSLSCCNWLNNQATGDPSGSKTPMGLCARSSTDANFKVCYLPNLVNATCDESSGAACQAYGIITSYDHPVACCNALATMMKSTSLTIVDEKTQLVSVTLTGVCSPHIPTLVPPPAPAPPEPTVVTPNVRKLQGRGLMQTDAAAAAAATANAKKPGDPGYIDNSTLWPLQLEPKFLEDPCATPGSCTIMQIDQTVNVTYFNSTTVMDDLAWSSLWMYKATNEPHYLGNAQHMLDMHYQKELPEDIMSTSRDIYVSDWNYQGWAANLMLAEITDAAEYHDRLRSLLNVWLFGDAVPSQPVIGLPEDILLNGRVYDNFTVTSPVTGKNSTYAIIPKCTPIKTFEQFCFDGKDDDCNGLVDREDPACGLFPILYSPKELAFSKAPSLPNAANTAFLALAYAQVSNGDTPNKLRCWALAQIGHMLGSGADERSFVVGVGKNPPTMIQHRASSCPLPPGVTTWDPSVNDTNSPKCDWSSGFYPATPNPRLNMIAGALVGGPDRYDNILESRSSDQMRVAMYDNAGFLSAIAGLAASNTNVRSCESLNGLWQRYAAPQKYV